MAARAATTATEGAVEGAAAGGAVAGAVAEAGGGEDRRTWGQKVLSPRVFAILEPEKGRKGGGGFINGKRDVK